MSDFHFPLAKDGGLLGEVECYVGSIHASESGGLEAQEQYNPEGWLWMDRSVTVRQ